MVFGKLAGPIAAVAVVDVADAVVAVVAAAIALRSQSEVMDGTVAVAERMQTASDRQCFVGTVTNRFGRLPDRTPVAFHRLDLVWHLGFQVLAKLVADTISSWWPVVLLCRRCCSPVGISGIRRQSRAAFGCWCMWILTVVRHLGWTVWRM